MEKLQSSDQISLLFSMYTEQNVIDKENFKQLLADIALIGEHNHVLAGYL